MLSFYVELAELTICSLFILCSQSFHLLSIDSDMSDKSPLLVASISVVPNGRDVEVSNKDKL